MTIWFGRCDLDQKDESRKNDYHRFGQGVFFLCKGPQTDLSKGRTDTKRRASRGEQMGTTKPWEPSIIRKKKQRGFEGPRLEEGPVKEERGDSLKGKREGLKKGTGTFKENTAKKKKAIEKPKDNAIRKKKKRLR